MKLKYLSLVSKNLSNVKVVPNPYLVNSNFNETKHIKRIRFTNITEQCEIQIFTLNGELVNTIHHENSMSGNAFWDLRTINNQEAVPGLYIFHISDKSEIKQKPVIGKFAIVR